MATKAELEKELAALKQELAKSRDTSEAKGTSATKKDDTSDDNANGLKKLLADHGVDADNIESLSETLLDELKSLQKEKPLTLALAAFALGLVVGRASK